MNVLNKEIEADTVTMDFNIKHTYNRYKLRRYSKHVVAKPYYDKVRITFSSKLIASRDDLIGITEERINLIQQKIDECTPYTASIEDILYSPLSRIDLKTDILNDTEVKHSDFISILTDRASYRTNKDEIITYDKKSGVNDSLVIRSTCKTVYDSLCIYPKIAELRSTKRLDPEYFNLFSEDFLIKNANLIRFERRLQNSRTIKQVFGLQHLKYVTLADIFNSERDVVAERIQHFFLWGNE